MAEAKLTLEQFSALLKNINSDLGPAATQLWNEGVNTEVLLRQLTKEDMQTAHVNLGSRVCIYEHYHPADAGQYIKQPLDVLKTLRTLLPHAPPGQV